MYWFIHNFDRFRRCHLFMDTCIRAFLYYMRHHYCHSYGNNYLYGYRHKCFRLQ